MQSNLGKVSYDNKVVGNKSKDNKDPKNKQKDNKGASQMGTISGNQKAKYYDPQNSPERTSKFVFSSVSGNNQADAGVKVEQKRQKTIIRKNALYSDAAIAVAKRARG